MARPSAAWLPVLAAGASVLFAVTELRAAPLRVAVSILPQKFLAERVGGELVEVTVLVGPGQSPETFEPTPRQIARLEAAEAYFLAGVPFELAWSKRLAAAYPDMRLVSVGDAEEANTHDHHDGDDADEQDPHGWTSPKRAMAMATRMLSTYEALDPDNAAIYRERHGALLLELSSLDRAIEAELGGLSARTFMVFHPAWGALAKDYGLKQLAIERGGKEPGPRSFAERIDEARRIPVRAVFVSPQASKRVAAVVAHALGVPLVDADPLAENYIENLREVVKRISEALR